MRQMVEFTDLFVPGQHATTIRLRSLQNALIAAFV